MRPHPYAARLLSAAVIVLAAASAAKTVAEPAPVSTPPDRVFASPPPAVPEPEQHPQTHAFAVTALAPAPLQTTDAFVDPRQDILYKFSIQFTEGELYNPWTLSQDKVRLRSYHGSSVDPATPFLAPTITMRPGQTVRIQLANNLFETDSHGMPLPPTKCVVADMNTPHCFNETNLHAHGLWVSPAGNSDNVLISIDPGVTFDYEYDVPSDHPAGTFWYHPHKHGSTALQVSSGMTGALIIKDDRAPTERTPGDLDILLVDGQGRPLEDKVMMFQQVQYACFDQDGKIEKLPAGQPWTCKPGQVGEIRDYAQQFSPSSTWQSSGRFTSINGRVQPEIDGLQAGRFERWRLIHGGVREAVDFRLIPLSSKAPDFRKIPAKDQGAFMRTYCAGPSLPMWEAALDGLTRSDVRQATESRLQPGYRADMIVYFPTAGRYCVIDGATDAKSSPSNAPENQKLLAVAVVSGVAPTNAPPEDQLKTLMVAAARRNIPSTVMQDLVVADLQNGLKLSKFVWHKTIDEKELNAPPQELAFNIDTAHTPAIFEVNGAPYDPNRIDRKMTIGQVQEWRLTSQFAAHPFHIHVNPFQVISVLNAADQDVTDPKTSAFDPDYAGILGQWKDTLFVKQGYNLVVRTRYERYIGEYVLHCHILDHEDQGMMQNVSISLPDGMGGIAEAHHH